MNTLCYTLRMIGKAGITVTVSNTNGNRFVDSYLNKVLDIWGANVVANVSIQKFPEDELTNQIKIQKAVEKVVETVKDVQLLYKLSDNQKLIFTNYKNHFKNAEESCLKEYWEKNRYFECGTVEEFINLKKSKFLNNE